MYYYFFHDTYTDIFEKEKRPHLTRLSHSYDNPTWSANYHVHRDEIELAYVESGIANYSLDIENFTVHEGDIIAIEPGVLHGLASDYNQPASIWSIGISNFKLKNQKHAVTLLPENGVPILNVNQEKHLIFSLINEIHEQHQHHTNTSMFLCNQLAETLVALYSQYFEHCRIHEYPKNHSFARDIMIYINFHYAQKISLESLASRFHMSEDHISHEFKNVYGVSPINYTIDRRICEAKWLLINTIDSLSVIAQQIGYENVNYFTNLFTRRIGMTPTAFRYTYGTHKNKR